MLTKLTQIIQNFSQFKSSEIDNSQSVNIIEAQGWIKDDRGNVILVADATTVTPHNSWQMGEKCYAN